MKISPFWEFRGFKLVALGGMSTGVVGLRFGMVGCRGAAGYVEKHVCLSNVSVE